MLDTAYYKANYGVYMQTTAPPIAHPVIPVEGNLFYCLSRSPAADGTRAADWHLCNFQGVKPVCACAGFRYHATCPHLAIVEAEMPALIAEMDAWFAADRAARKAARLTREVAA